VGREAPDIWLAAIAEQLQDTGSAHYRTLAAALRCAIAREEIPVGTRLPPQRELALRLGIGRSTVLDAYNLLRADSLISSQQGAGTWVVRRT
jgi:DNA-binding FadR family transcriptional regulator